MLYLLDTSVCVSIIRGNDQSLADKLKPLELNSLFLCSIVVAELRVGVEKSKDRLKANHRLEILSSQFQSLPFDDEAAGKYGQIRAHLEVNGVSVGANDLLIASIALAKGMTLITKDADFERILGLNVLKW